jgi:hypothetical protein
MNKVTRIALERPAPTVLEHPMLFGNGSRLGLRVIGPGGQPMYIEGWQLYVLFRTMERHLLLSSSLSREALLEVARQHKHKLPPPSWWSDATKGGSELSRAPEELKPAPGTAWYDRPRDLSEPSRSTEELKPASEAMTKEEMWSVCKAEEAAGRKDPNVKELSAAVKPLLERKGFWASRRWIEKLAEASEFKSRRRPRGKTVASEQRKK